MALMVKEKFSGGGKTFLTIFQKLSSDLWNKNNKIFPNVG